MFTLIRWAFLSCLAVLAGVAAVSVPILGKTVADHIGDLAGPYIEELTSRTKEKALSVASPEPVAEELTDEDREALEALLGDRAAAP